MSVQPVTAFSYVVEHLDPELGPWSALEYDSIARESHAANARFLLTSVPEGLEMPADLAAVSGLEVEHRSIEEIFAGKKDRVCLLDPAAKTELSPEDGFIFDVFLFGGILGDDPPRVPLENVPYVDYPELRINEHESTEMPFRYVKNDKGEPIMPEYLVFGVHHLHTSLYPPYSLSSINDNVNLSFASSSLAGVVPAMLRRVNTSASADLKSAADYYVSFLPGQPDGTLPKMHAGHIEVDHEKNGNLFFWHFENKYVVDKTRTLLWLNGGPGCSSLDGALMEIGPFRLANDHTLQLQDSSWNDYANVLFVDQPFGTGFSYANTDSLDHEMTEIADHMVTFLEKWFAIFPQYESDDLYIAGESFAGQHIPYVANAIIDRNRRIKSDGPRWALKGLLIGNGWISPREQYESYVKFANEKGILVPGTQAARAVDEQLAICRGIFKQSGTSDKIDVSQCESVLNMIIDGTEMDGKCYNLYDVRLQEPYPACGSNWPPDLKYLTPYLRRDDVRESLHINPDKKTGWEECSGAVSKQLQNRNSKPAVQLLPSLIDSGVSLLLFSGADDMICNHIGTEDLIENMEWLGAKGFGNTSRYDWTFEGEKVGFYQEARNLTYVLFYNASHMVPYDHPARAVDMLNRFMQVDVADVLSIPVGSILDGSNNTKSAKLDDAREKKLHELELQTLRNEGEQRLRAAVHDAYKKSFFACIIAFCAVIGAIALITFLRKQCSRNIGSQNEDLGSYSRVADDEEAISLTRISKHVSTDDHLDSMDFDESQLPILHNVPELNTPISQKPDIIPRND
ncbi:Cell death protease [Ascosphaera aggregata]|nr:Cell death protease [Ascosphaera aggregata]